MGKDNKAPKAPNYSKQLKQANKISKEALAVAKRNQQIGEEQIAHFREQAIEDRAKVDAVNADLVKTADREDDFGAYLQDRYKNVFQPLEDDLIQEFKDYATPGRYDLNRGRAMADVGQQFDAARKNAVRELESYGINPSATRFAALDLGVRVQEAAAKAAAANQADLQTDAVRRGLRGQGIELGLKYPGFADQAVDTGINARNDTVANTLNATNTAASSQGTAPQFNAIGVSGLNAGTGAIQASTAAQKAQYDGQMAEYNANQEASSGIGDVLGLAAGIGTKAFLGPSMPWVFAAEGGAIPDPNQLPGAVPDGASPSGGAAIDDVNAKLTAGEFVLPEDVTRWIGEKKLQDMILKAREEKSGAKAKPTQGEAIPGPPTYTSRPGVGAIPNR